MRISLLAVQYSFKMFVDMPIWKVFCCFICLWGMNCLWNIYIYIYIYIYGSLIFNLPCPTLYTGHHLWSQKELLAVGVYLASVSSQYVWSGTQMRAVLCPVHHLLNLQCLRYNSRDQYLRGTVHRLQYIRVCNKIPGLYEVVVLAQRLYCALI
jgi:hypothetical protein